MSSNTIPNIAVPKPAENRVCRCGAAIPNGEWRPLYQQVEYKGDGLTEGEPDKGDPFYQDGDGPLPKMVEVVDPFYQCDNCEYHDTVYHAERDASI